MKSSSTFKRIVSILAKRMPVVVCIGAVLLLSGCLRRPLWVYTDEYRQVELITDWSNCDRTPGGMTAWFSKNDYEGQNRRITTAEVEHTWLNLPNGRWSAVVFDYSPDEFGGQLFYSMHRPDSCYVRCRPSSKQPVISEMNEHLYGDIALPDGMQIGRNEATGYNILSADPDPMYADTLHQVHIVTGVDGDLILWKDQDTYGSTLETQTFYAYPKPITWKLRVFVNVRGINYMSAVKSSIAGLADGNHLSVLRHTPNPCLHPLDEWEVTGRNSSTNAGTLGCTIDTFGLPGEELDRSAIETILSGTNSKSINDNAYAYEINADGKPIQLNLQFILRDEATIVNYHFATTHTGADTPYDKDTRLYEIFLRPEYIRVFAEQRVIRIDIPIGVIELPYVDAKDSAGFDAEVSPWEDGDMVDVGF